MGKELGMSEYLTTKDVMKMLNVQDRKTIYNYRKRGLLKAHKLGMRCLYDSEEVKNMLTREE